MIYMNSTKILQNQITKTTKILLLTEINSGDYLNIKSTQLLNEII